MATQNFLTATCNAEFREDVNLKNGSFLVLFFIYGDSSTHGHGQSLGTFHVA